MMVATAVILAAGRGVRLRGEHQDKPKGFLVLGEKPIVAESVERLRAAGIKKIIIVTGYCAEFYADFARENDDVVTVHNSRYAESGTMYSLYCALELVEGPFLLLESDLIYEQRALTVLLDGSPEAILLAGTSDAGDEVWVVTENSHLINMSKDTDALGAEPSGELVGISRISAKLSLVLREYAEQVAYQDMLSMAYETGGLVHAGRHMPIRCPIVPDLIWSEIDDASQLEHARSKIYPQLV
jgi:2-aminoethylphosphonate-pyruvate transaminase